MSAAGEITAEYKQFLLKHPEFLEFARLQEPIEKRIEERNTHKKITYKKHRITRLSDDLSERA
jgi:hypothetical protein